MKTISILASLLILAFTGVQAQVVSPPTASSQATTTGASLPAPTPYQIVDRGANHKLWQRKTYQIGPKGQVVTLVHQYQEIATGMNYQSAGGQWVESQDLIQSISGGAIARQGQYQVIFANNLNSTGAIDQQTPDGKRLRSNILGLAYYDSASGKSALVAQIQDSQGELISANQVLYPNAFSGVKADVSYTYKKGSFEQDVILREQPPTPESFGLNSVTTELEVMTEFLKPPKETIKRHQGRNNSRLDEDVSWGAMQLGHGKAFDLGKAKNSRQKLSVQRQYDTVNGRKILLEIVPVPDIQANLQALPLQSSIQTKHPTLASTVRNFPSTPLAQDTKQPMKLAMDLPANQGFVLDYVELNTDQSDFTFRGDMTYCISGNVNLSGNTTFEGGTVIKYDTNNACSLNVLGTINCQTAAYRPAVFTSVNDFALGEGIYVGGSGGAAPCTGTLALQVQNNWSEDLQYVWIYDSNWNLLVDVEGGPDIISGSSADYSFITGLSQPCYFYAYDVDWNFFYGSFSPTLENGTLVVGGDGSVNYSESGSELCDPPPPMPPPPVVALALANGGTVHDVRISNVGTAISSAGNYSVLNGQFVNCGTALDTENTTLYAGNILMSQVGTAFYGQGYQATAENITFDQGTLLTDDPDGSATTSAVTLDNSLLTVVGGYGVVPVTTSYVQNLWYNSGVYQTVGAGSYYLANNTYRNSGTAPISQALQADLQQKTTYPPTVYTGVTFSTTTFAPQAPRDTNSAPDLGYHYDPLDYVFGDVSVSASVTFTPGTAVGWYEADGTMTGISMNDGGILQFQGTATAPCNYARYDTVQEGNGNWTGKGWLGGVIFHGSSSANPPQLNAGFTKWEVCAADPNQFGDNWATGVGRFSECELYGGDIGSYGPAYYFTNCLIYRIYTAFWSQNNAASITCQNCTFYNGGLALCRYSGQSASFWKIQNTSFDGTALIWADNFNGNTNYTYFNYNSYNSANISWQNYDFGVGIPSSGTLETVGANDIMVTNGYNWQSSWFGNFYLPANSPLIDHGSTNANLLGFYHYTTQTNQTIEGISIVDIGYHYVATDPYGKPLDANGNGIPDYLEDANGDGIFDAGDLADWCLPVFSDGTVTFTNGLKMLIFEPKPASYIP